MRMPTKRKNTPMITRTTLITKIMRITRMCVSILSNAALISRANGVRPRDGSSAGHCVSPVTTTSMPSLRMARLPRVMDSSAMRRA